jgi:triphosphoribosyl-dephospho-CoA synthase
VTNAHGSLDMTPSALDRNAHIASAAQLACLLEVIAPKPGNVSPGRHFPDARFEDFLASAAAIGPCLVDPERPLGATVRLAVDASRSWTRSNTNLGIVLLLTPLAKAAASIAARDGRDAPAGAGSLIPSPVVVERQALRGALQLVLDSTTIEDARDVYSAIRRAAPGGLGRADAQDVTDEPTVSLLEAMRLAAERDGIAREYVTTYEVTFEESAPALDGAREAGLSWNDAIVETFLTLLARRADTHIARRAGSRVAEDVSRWARAALDSGGVRTARGQRTIEEMDRALRGPENLANPGTTADLTAAAIFVVLLGGGWGGMGASG